MLAGGTALGGLSRGASAQAKEMDFWYWGEQELPGLQKYVNDSVAAYKAATVKPMLQDTAVVISQFQTAAAAGNAPDIQYLWNGIYHMESVWLGYVKGLKGLVKDDILAGLEPHAAQPLRRRHLPHRLVPAADVLVLQQDAVREGRPRPRSAAQDLGRAARRLREAEDRRHRALGRRHPGWLLERMVHHPFAAPAARLAGRGGRALHRRQGLPRSEISPALGEARGAEDARATSTRTCRPSNSIPASTSWWRARWRSARPSARRLPADSKATGGKIGYMTMPVFGKGKLAGVPVVDVQGLGISTNAEDPAAAAAFLEFLQIARAAQGLLGRRPAGFPPTPPSTPA